MFHPKPIRIIPTDRAPRMDEAAAAAAVVQRLRVRLASVEDLRVGVAQSLRQLDAEIQELRQVLGDARAWRPAKKPSQRIERRCRAVKRLLTLNHAARLKDLHRWCTEIIGPEDTGSLPTFLTTMKRRPDMFIMGGGGRGLWTLHPLERIDDNDANSGAPAEPHAEASPGMDGAPLGSIRGPSGMAASQAG